MSIQILLAPILKVVLEYIGMPSVTYEIFQSDGVYTCNVYYGYEDAEGNRYISFAVGVSSESVDEAKNIGILGVIDFLKSYYVLDILDYNYRDMVIYKLNCEYSMNNKVNALRSAYERLAGQYVSLGKKCAKLLKAMRKLKAVFRRFVHLI